jgi:pyruvate dehydrogenase (quinone)
MNGLNELITVKKYWERWGDPRLLFIVLNNQDLNQVSWEMRIEEGNPRLPLTQSLPDFPYASFAESIGLHGIRVAQPDQVGKAIDEALSASRPVVLEAVTDPDVPTLPPHITIEQARAFASTLRKGDPEERGILTEAVKELADGILPHRG